MSITKSYTFNGEVSNSIESWIKWSQDAKMIFNELGVQVSKCTIISEKDEYIKVSKNIEERIQKIYNKKDSVISMTFLALPNICSSYAFDYIVTLTRSAFLPAYITLILNYEYNDLYNSAFNQDELVSLLKTNINNSYGEIYEMDINECPELYAGKTNSKSFYKSLNIIKQI